MVSAEAALQVVSPGRGEAIQVMSDRVTVKVRSQDSRAPFALTEVTTPPGGGPPGLHRHTDQETFYVVAGRYRFDTLADDQPRSVEAAAGAVVHIPSQVWHNYQNTGQAPGTLLVLLQPGDMLDFFRELGVPLGDPASPPPPAGPPDLARVRALTQKHHVEMYYPSPPKGA